MNRRNLPWLLRWLARASVMVWMTAAFTWLGWQANSEMLETVAVSAQPEATRAALEAIEPEKTKSPPPAKAQAPQPAPSNASPARSVRPAQPADLASGQRILDGGGSFPAVSASYEGFRSFERYARAMQAIGARFVVLQNRQIVARVELDGRFSERGELGGFSPRARNYSEEPGVGKMTRAARARYGKGAVVRMLVPRNFDAALFGALERRLIEKGRSASEFREVRGRYRPSGRGGVEFHAEAVVRRDGRSEPLELALDVSQVGRRG